MNSTKYSASSAPLREILIPLAEAQRNTDLMVSHMLRLFLMLICCLFTIPRESFAQSAPRPATAGRKSPVTQVTVELLTGNEGVGAGAQRWSQVFQELNTTVTIRRGRADDKTGITERKIGDSVREIKLVGRLDPRGRVIFEDRVFTEADSRKLHEWLTELKTYGAQGTPDGQPMWGLSKTQFGLIHAPLSKPLEKDPRGEELNKALALFALPAELPLRVSTKAETILRAVPPRMVKQSFEGVSKGTALAAMLNEQGLGFRPRRAPNGDLDLMVVSLSETDDVWPVGWPLQKTGPATAPKLFAYTQVDLEEIELDSVLEAASGLLEMPVLIDHYNLAAKRIDLSKFKVSHPAKRTTWGIALRTLTAQAKVKPELMIDDAGRPFLWIIPFGAPKPAE